MPMLGTSWRMPWTVVSKSDAMRPVMVAGKALTYQFLVDTGGAAPVIQKDFLNGLRCVPQAAR